MEERHPRPADSMFDPAPPPIILPGSHSPADVVDEKPPQALVPSPSRNWQRHTYVIQVPKDQIYRVPPPENAKILERYRQPDRKKPSPWRRCVFCLILTLVIISLFGGLGAVVYTLTLKPKLPRFEIKHLVTKYPNAKLLRYSSRDYHPRPSGFDVLLEITNPNGVITIGYDEGNVTLLYKANDSYDQLGKGESPSLEQQGKGVDEVHVPIVAGNTTSIGMSKQLDESMHMMKSSDKKNKNKNNKKDKDPIGLRLKTAMPVKLKTWMSTKSSEFSVTCDFVVSSLAKDKDANILSQKCVTVES